MQSISSPSPEQVIRASHSVMSAQGGFDFMARSVRGLEWVVAAEVKGRLGAKITAISHREVHFHLSCLDPQLTALRTVDDVFLTCGVVEGLDRTRASLHRLSENIRELDFATSLSTLRCFRTIRHPDRFDVVASSLGRRNYSRFEVEETVGCIIHERLGMVQQPSSQRSGADIAWRIHLQDHKAYVGLRLMPIPLHRRSYRSSPYKGSLHPPVAAAMALLVGLYPDLVFLDPFCGSGTIGIEASCLEDSLRILVSDIDPSAVSLACSATEQSGIQLLPWIADAGRLPLAYRTVDRIVSNIPWERHVERKGCLCFDPSLFWQEIRRVMHSESRFVVLSERPEPPTEQLQTHGLCLVLRCPIRLRGCPVFISALTLESHSYPTPIDEYGMLGKELQSEWEAYVNSNPPQECV